MQEPDTTHFAGSKKIKKTPFNKKPKNTIPPEIEKHLYDRMIFIQRSKRWWDLLNGKPVSSITNLYTEINAMFPDIDDAGQYLWKFHGARHARMVDDLGYFPGEPEIVEQFNLKYVNTWTGWRTTSYQKRDIQPFLDMTDSMFQGDSVNYNWMLDLLAWHAQNPMKHIPYALVVSGSRLAADLWAHAFYNAFEPFAVRFGVVHLRSMNREWMRNASFGLMNGTTNALSNKLSREILAQMIVSPEARSISNSRNAVSFGRNDISRMLVMITMPSGKEAIVDTPGVYFILPAVDPPEDIMRKFQDWIERPQSGAQLMQWLLDRNVRKFTPPVEAPETQYAYLSRRDNMSPIQRLADDMMASEDNYVAKFISDSLEWAEAVLRDPGRISHNKMHAKQIMSYFPDITVRPWYTVEEIMMMFPAVYAQTIEGMKSGTMPPGHVSKELRAGGLRMLLSSDNPKGFLRNNVYEQFFVIHDKTKWSKPISQEEFDRLMKAWPTYREFVQQMMDNRNDQTT